VSFTSGKTEGQSALIVARFDVSREALTP